MITPEAAALEQPRHKVTLHTFALGRTAVTRAQFSAFKGALVELAVESLAPLSAEMKRLVADPAHIDAVLADGAERASAIAPPTLDAVKDIVGFVRRDRTKRAV